MENTQGNLKEIISTLFNENFAHFKYNRPEKSAIDAYYIM